MSAGLTQARHSERESNYRDNYDCDLVRPGFVFKWTHLPRALERRLLRPHCEPRVLCPPPPYLFITAPMGVLHSSTRAHSAYADLSAGCIMDFRFH